MAQDPNDPNQPNPPGDLVTSPPPAPPAPISPEPAPDPGDAASEESTAAAEEPAEPAAAPHPSTVPYDGEGPHPNDPTDKPNVGDESASVDLKVLETFELGKPAPSDLFAVMDASGVEDSFSTEQPLRGHQLAFKGQTVDLSVIHQIENVKRTAAQA